MSRGLTSGMTDALTARRAQIAMLVKLVFDSGTDYLWSGYGDLSWDGQTWKGAGELVGAQPFSETTEVSATRAQVTISGIPSVYISTALQEDYQGRPATLYFAALDSNGDVIADPAEFAGRMDQMEINKTGDTMLIRLSVESQLIDLHKPREFRYTDQDQRIDYPDDKGFEYVAGLQDKNLTWGPDNRSADQKVRDMARRRGLSIETRRTRVRRGQGFSYRVKDVAVDDQGNILAHGQSRWGGSASNASGSGGSRKHHRGR